MSESLLRPNPGVFANETVAVHHDLHNLYTRLTQIHISADSFGLLMPTLPILDKSAEIKGKQWGQEEDLPGIRLLREAIKSDLDRLEAVSKVS